MKPYIFIDSINISFFTFASDSIISSAREDAGPQW